VPEAVADQYITPVGAYFKKELQDFNLSHKRQSSKEIEQQLKK
jgi:hypothetical protein